MERATLRAELRDISNRMGALGSAKTLTGDERTELRTLMERHDTLVAQHGARARLDDIRSADAGESAERNRLMAGYRITSVADAMANQAVIRGAEAEANAAHNLDGYQAPLSVLSPSLAVTPGATTAPASDQDWLTSVFPMSLLDFASVRTDLVQWGAKIYNVVSGGAVVGFKANSDAADETAGTVTAVEASPEGITGAARIRRRDELRHAPMAMEQAIRRQLRGLIATGLEKQVFAGNGTAPNPSGLFSVGSNPTAASAKATWATAVALFTSAVDAIYAPDLKAVRAVCNVEIYQFLAELRFGATYPGTLVDHLSMNAGGIMPSSHAPASSSNVGNILVVRGDHRRSRLTVWNGIELNIDRTSAAVQSTREAVITGTTWADFHVLDAGAYDRKSIKTA